MTQRRSRKNGKANRPAEASARRGGRPSQRADILEAAVTLFAKGGTRGTTLSAIAERIGVTAPAITHHFGTKEALLREVVANTDRLDASALNPPAGASGMEQLQTTRNWARVLSGDSQLSNLSRLSVVMTGEALDPEYPAHQHFVLRNRQFREAVEAIIQTGQRDGSIRSDVDARKLAAEIMSFMQGAGLQWFLDPDDFDLIGVYDFYFDRLTAELTPPSRRASGARRS